eukprot:Gb_28613 [translate_table: standard]
MRIHPEEFLRRELLVSQMTEGWKYELVANVSHHGRYPSKGHYTTNMKLLDGQGEELKKRDFTKLELSPNHFNRPKSMHEYNLTPHSLYVVVFMGIETKTIIIVRNKLSKTKLPKEIIDFINSSTGNYGKVKLVLKKNCYFVESPFPEGGSILRISKAPNELEGSHLELLVDEVFATTIEEKETHSVEIDATQVVKQRCLQDALNYPMLEEYNFKNDTTNPNLNMESVSVRCLEMAKLSFLVEKENLL